ncbi:MAG: hypothetical protein Q4P07_06070 [Ornithinimicrobium sp.]|uniref:sunset domain-containing protein n=1 Tax=Ornithinimicrobium sp. TaxID=1977084 RepID=UPI0026E0FD12|nr:hypothetical protein [Ornithinimicrobium sp.]MDO5739698.1 hypothetical protein [Ornithinimicrobium sp.]
MNDATKWIMIALLLLLIGAAVFMLLRSPGKDATDDSVDQGLDRDRLPDADRAREARADEVFDQHAPARGDEVDDSPVGDPASHDDAATGSDNEWMSRAAQIGAMGAAGTAVAGVGDAALHGDEAEPVLYDDELQAVDPVEADSYDEAAPVETVETDSYVDSEPIVETTEADSYDQGASVETFETDSYGQAPPVDTTEAGFYVDSEPIVETTEADSYGQGASVETHEADSYAEPAMATDPSTDDLDGDYVRHAASIGAVGAAGTTASVDSEDVASIDDGQSVQDYGQPDQEAPPVEFATEQSDANVGESYAPVEDIEVEPLSEAEIMDGARSEPLGLDDQEPLTADEVLAGGDSADDSTTYRADAGEAVRVEEEPTDYGYDDSAPSPSTGYDDSAPSASEVDTVAADDGADGAGAVYDGDGVGLVDGAAEAPTTDAGQGFGAPVFTEAVYGAGSAEPAEDGSGPAGWEVKGNAGSMLFHTAESPSYRDVRAEVWFESEEAARNAGFAHWDRRRR